MLLLFAEMQALKTAPRIAMGVMLGMAVLVGGIWVLSKSLGNNRAPKYEGRTPDYWAAQICASDVAASNQANRILNTEIIPELTDQMFHDTYDSALRMELVGALDDLPGILVDYVPAGNRRAVAAIYLGMFGPAAKAAIPALMQAAQGNDPAVHAEAIRALGEIHGEPEIVVPLLTKYLSDDELDVLAAKALANYGNEAKSAVPQLIPMLHAGDDDDQAAAAFALKQIDPQAYAEATNNVPDGK